MLQVITKLDRSIRILIFTWLCEPIIIRTLKDYSSSVYTSSIQLFLGGHNFLKYMMVRLKWACYPLFTSINTHRGSVGELGTKI